MRVDEPLDHPPADNTGPSVFLAAGPDATWQQEALLLLANAAFTGTVFNPVPTSPIADRDAPWRPFGWHQLMLRRSTAALFWNPPGPVMATDLLSRHAFGFLDTAIVVGCDPDMPGPREAKEQFLRAMPWLTVEQSLPDAVNTVLASFATTLPSDTLA
ncbi:hypothetical protein F7Q99_21195 [Streptomyces kaniharaensis]|uniref:Nucleoside 2-deoxyribosyltransferase n=1 Tax=Streptomyces kaniharaensis TaxID=212423 RepID=A0A6N7KT62_9ACTN|nr:hypothetical protein [Streptomyces kaniharaensis]MQS14710.1 hypothetical protein [Streptomyces kaniharaensis]